MSFGISVNLLLEETDFALYSIKIRREHKEAQSKVSPLKNLRFFNFQALDPKFVLAQGSKVLKLEGLSF